MANVLLGVTGSVAAVKTPALYEALRAQGHRVRVVATAASLYFFDPVRLAPTEDDPTRRDPAVVSLDEDEWPGRDRGGRYARGDSVLHVELRRWADLFLVAPLDANTLAKLAAGLADNCLTCVWRAWDPARPVVLAPAMNTLMWEHPLTARHLRALAGDDAASPRLLVVPPESRALACGDIGVGAMAALDRITAAVAASLSGATSGS